MDSLPIELLDIIVSHGSDVYYGLLGYKFFTDSLTFSKRVDFMILFEHSIKITKCDIKWMRKKEVIMVDHCPYEFNQGYQAWYRNGNLHRKYGPAYKPSYENTEWWYLYGKLHREGGPAIEDTNGNKQWYQNGERHREGGPAFEWVNGTKQWYKHGKLHRDNDLPAVQKADGTGEWYRHGKRYRKKEHWLL